MNFSATRKTFLVTLAFVVCLIFSILASRNPRRLHVPASAASSIEGTEDPRARIAFEWLKYHDPATGDIPRDIRRQELAVAARIPTVESMWGRLGKSSGGESVQSTIWVRRGPYNVGGRTRAFAVDVNDTSILVAGGVSGGMWRSTDGGVDWTVTTDPGELHSVTCLVQDTRPGKTNIWYHGTGELFGNSASMASAPYRGDGLFKSTDDGMSWARLPSTAVHTPQVFVPPWDYVWNVATDNSRADSDVVYAATIGAIMRSNDGGTSWQLEKGTVTNPSVNPQGPFGPRFTDVIVTPNGVVYAGLSWLNLQLQTGVSAVDAGIWRSPDGLTWTNITPPAWPSANYTRIVLACAPSNPNAVYVLAETPGVNPTEHSLWKYTYLSGDGTGAGGAWQNRSANLPNENGATGAFYSQNSYDLVIGVKPDNEQVVFIGGISLYRSNDGWATNTNWKRIGGYLAPGTYQQWANHHCDQHSISFNPRNPGILLNGNDGGVYVTYNDTSNSVIWNSLNNGYYNTQFYAVAIDHGTAGDLAVMGGMQDNGTYFTNNGAADVNWVQELGGDGTYCSIADGGTSDIFSSQEGNYYLAYFNDVGDYTQWTCITPTGAGPFLFVNPFALDPNNQNRMYLPAGNTLWRNNNLAGIPLYSTSTTTKNWDSLSATRLAGITYTAVAAAKVPSGRVYVASSDGHVFRLENANTGNPSPIDISSGKGLPAAYVNCIAVDPSNGDKALLVFTNYGVQSLFSTSDAGNSWTPVGGNLEQNPSTGLGGGPSTRWAAILPPGGRASYFVGTSVGLYSASFLNGISTVWTQEGSSSIGNLPVDMIQVRPSDGYIVVATHGGGIFSAFVGLQISVYPGDANNDGVVDVRDLLPIGRFYGTHGPARLGGNTTWGPQTLATAWTPADAGFADCDGNGVVDSNDVVALIQNWMATRSQGVPATIDYRAAAAEILGALDNQTTGSFASAMRNAVLEYVNRGSNAPSEFALHQNYPNPFNPSTNIQFSVPQGVTSATLTVYDIAGRLVWQQRMDGLTPGGHTARWDGRAAGGSTMASGVYFYRLVAGGQVATKRMVLLK
ncbi:MAG TPA: T9SS type A sorting domain-containing protein [Bacteroidota bacterium]